jgi:glucoamylase
MLEGISLPRRGAALVVSACALLGATAQAQAKPQAPRAPGAPHTWAPADKHGFGTAHQLASNAWFTLRQGSLSEIYYPNLSTPSFRGLQFAVTDGMTFVDRETVDDDPRHIEPLQTGVTASVKPADGSLRFEQVTSRPGAWRLTKTWITDPARATVLANVRFESLTGRPLKLYVLADPAPGNDGNDDHGITPNDQLVAYDEGGDVDGDGIEDFAASASAVTASPAFERTTSGYRGTASDPWVDLKADYMLSNYDALDEGNVVQGARTALNGLRGNQTMTLAIGFGGTTNAAIENANASLAGGFAAAQSVYDKGWKDYRATLDAAPASVGTGELRKLYDQSVLVLAASEDKTYRGASIASPSMPWIWGTMALEPERRYSGPYHLVWPRDFYHVAVAQKAVGDDAAADRLLDYLWTVQKPATADSLGGDFWQNTWVWGTEKWTSEQLDQTSLPIVLSWWLGRKGRSDWAHVERAADYIIAKGPDTGQERWENQGGWSPNTIATEIAGLICAADIARANGEDEKAALYEQTADAWQQSVEGWTATSTGPYSTEPYYLRVTKPADPDDENSQPDPDLGTRYGLGDNFINNGDPTVDQRAVVDNSFLGLVLFGVKPWDDATIVNSLKVGDDTACVRPCELTPNPLKEDTPNGEVWHRFTFDGYGEQADGGDWDLFFDPRQPARQTRGRLWPLLSGERGEYELIAGDKGAAGGRLQTIGGTANDGLMLPEQVWDKAAPTGEQRGEGTRSATPLAWTHAQFIRLALSLDAGAPIERPWIVACRYQKQLCPTG